MISHLKVGIPITGSKGWLGGILHIEMHVKAVASLPKHERPKLFLIVYDETFDSFNWYKPFIALFDGIVYVGNNLDNAEKTLELSLIHYRSQEELFEFIDFYFPVSFNVLPNKCAASWIHDFQHKYLPELFPSEMHLMREKLCQYISQEAKLAFFSTKAVENDFRKFYPSSKTITRVLSLRISPEEEWYIGNPLETQEKYCLPNRFVICSNQFWQHKNHKCLFEAIAILKNAGQTIHLVCTGLTSDFRNHNYIEELTKHIKQLGISDLIHILGLIPRFDQIQLIRRSLFVIQPSLFEGLSLIVQECRTLGKAIILSDIDVHLEHEYGIYFKRTDPEDLAAKMSLLLSVSQPGPDIQRETEAKLQAKDLAKIYAKQFCNLVVESQSIFNIKKSPAIPIITSLRTEDDYIYDQQKAVKSWASLGFHIVSFNTADDIVLLQSQYPDVEFITAKHHFGVAPAKPFIYFDEILSYIKECNTEICGITEPDIVIHKPDFYSLIAQEARQSFVYSTRIDLKGLETIAEPPPERLGCCFFDKSFAFYYPQEKFCLGLAWWDYWAAIIPITRGIKLKKITAPLAFHKLKQYDYKLDTWLEMGNALTKYIKIPFTLDKSNLRNFHHLLSEVIKKNSINID